MPLPSSQIDTACAIEIGQVAGWGNAVVKRLAADLRAAFPEMSGFSSANLWAM